MKCTCQAWTENAAKLAQTPELVHPAAALPLETRTLFTYCPWCGDYLSEDHDNPTPLEDWRTKRPRSGTIDVSEQEWERCRDTQQRVSGKAPCPICHQPYDRHLTVSYKGEPIGTFQIDCTGQHVKT